MHFSLIQTTLSEMGDQGRRFLEEHHRPEMYAEALIDFVS